MKINLLLLQIFLYNFSYGQNSEIKILLENATSLTTNIDTINKNFIIRRFDITPCSFIRDGEELISGDLQDHYTKDSTLNRLLDLPANKITSIETDSTYEYYKVVRSDSILCIRYAYLGFPLDYKISIDTIYATILKQTKNGISWNKLIYHPTECYRPASSVAKGTSGWVRAENFDDLFIELIISHKVGDFFLYKSEKLNFGWIIYKTDTAQFFKRKQILFAILKPKGSGK